MLANISKVALLFFVLTGCGAAKGLLSGGTKTTVKNTSKGSSPAATSSASGPVATKKRKQSSPQDPYSRYHYEKAVSSLPSYEKEPKPQKRPKREVCGFYLYELKQDRRGDGWSNTRLSFNLNRKVHAAADCKFPRANAKMRAAAKLAQNLLRRRKVQAFVRGDRVVVNGGWKLIRNRYSRRIMGRYASFMHYSKHHEVPLSNCLSANPKVVCENSDGSYGLAAERANIVHFRLEQAKAFQKQAQTTQCRIAAWDAMRNLKWAKRSGVRTGYTFKTRYNGVQNAEQIKALFTQQHQDAMKLFSACGGGERAPL
jgi:ribosome-binding protein aMBF1 (putative translation factor)